MPPYEALYGRKCRSPLCWTEVGEKQIEGLDLIRETSKKVPLIQERLRTAFSRQRSYADLKRRDVQFNEDDHVFLKISPMNGVKRFGMKEKLASRYIGPYHILDRVKKVSYRLALPPQMSQVHPVFHISLLRKYVADPTHVLPVQEVALKEDFSYVEHPVAIVDKQSKMLRNKEVALVKVQWHGHSMEECT